MSNMLFAFLGKSPPKKKPKTVVELEKRERDRVYDHTKRQREFKQSWLKEFAWLLVGQGGGDKEAKYFCKYCRSSFSRYSHEDGTIHLPPHAPNMFKRYAGGPFVCGCQNFQKSALYQHESSKGHTLAAEQYRLKHEVKPGCSQAEKSIQSLNEKIFKKLEILFRSAHGIAKHSRPFTDLVWISELDEKKNLDVGHTYRNDKSCREFISAIAEVERDKLRSIIANEAMFLSIISDGSTDVSVIENEGVFIRTAIKGKIHVFFVAMIPVKKADAKGIYAAILKALKQMLIEKEDDENRILHMIICFGSDSASVNVGTTSGVIALMKTNICDNIISIGCLVHKLELAYKKSMKSFKLYDKVITLLSQLYCFYHRSALQKANLQQAYEASDVESVTPTRIGGTRWLSHTVLALDKLWKGYSAFVLHLSQVAIQDSSAVKPKAKALLKLLKCKNLIVFAHFLHDILNTLGKVSLELQQREASVYQCHSLLEVAKSTIKKYLTRPGHHLRKVREVDVFKGVTLTGNLKDFETALPKVVESILLCLEDRFKDTGEGVLQATKLADLTSWPCNYQEDFGDDFVSTLTNQFEPMLRNAGVQLEDIDMEWSFLKRALYQNDKAISELDWIAINEKYSSQCRNILAVIDLILTLPASSAECERGFSSMKLVKTDIRNRLSSSGLTDLLTVQLHSPSIADFDPKPAIHLWNRQKIRKPRKHSQYAKKVVLPVEPAVVVENEELAANGTQMETEIQQKDFSEDSDSDFSELSDYGSDYSEADLFNAANDIESDTDI